MGQRKTYLCENCGYRHEHGSGISTGFEATIATIACTRCGRIRDVAVDVHARDAARALEQDPSWRPEGLRCPRAKSHPITLWREGDNCPRCGTIMVVAPFGRIVLWD